MTIEALVERFGLIALFIGAGVEGEATVITGGVLAHKQLLPLYGAALAASAGSFTADQLLFWIGRRQRDRQWVRRLAARPGFARALAALERHPAGFILAFRFLVGLRTISPLAIGTSQVRTTRFLALNALAAALWGPLFTGIGYLFGTALAEVFDRLRPLEHGLLVGGGVLLLLGVLVGVARSAGFGRGTGPG